MTELVRALDRMGHSQAVVCGVFPYDIIDFPHGVTCYPVYFEDPETDASQGRTDSVQASMLPFPVVGMSDIMPYPSTRYRDLTPAMVSQFEQAFIEAVGRAVDELDPDLIICHHLFLLTALVRKHFPGRRIAGISHGTDLRQMINCSELAQMVRPYIKELDAVLALHSEQRSRIIELFNMNESRVSVIGSGYNAAAFNTDGRTARAEDEPLRLAYAGKISRPKGVPEMLAALERLSSDKSVPEFTLTMAGGCQDEVIMKKLEDLPHWAKWLGQIPQLRLAELLRKTDVFILPSYFEGLPLVLIEAMASGALPVSTDLPGVKSWIKENVGDPNAVYVPMPEMKSIDEPTDDGRIRFENDLACVLRRIVNGFASGELPGSLPDTSSITWDGLASKLLSICS